MEVFYPTMSFEIEMREVDRISSSEFGQSILQKRPVKGIRLIIYRGRITKWIGEGQRGKEEGPFFSKKFETHFGK